MSKLVNLTPHTVTIVKDGVPVLDIPSTGIARCKVSRVQVRTLEVNGVEIPVNETVFGEVYGLPSPEEDTVFIVSRPVISAIRKGGDNRDDLVSPDDTVRDDKGVIIGAKAVAI